MRRIWVAVLALAGVLGVTVFLAGRSGDTADARIGPVPVLVAGERVVLPPQRATAVRALTRAGITPRDGALRSAVSGTVLDPVHDHGYVLVNGRPASMDAKLRRGARVEVYNGADAVEETARREVPIGYANQDKVGTPGWLPGKEGLAAEVYGVLSGEVVERTVVLEPVAAREIVRPADVSAGSAVYLTFDDGPDPTWTPQLLDLLRSKGVRATFCVVGRYVSAHPDLARRIAADGHALCNHSQTHAQLDTLDAAGVEAEIGRAQSAIESATGVRPGVFRIPYGRTSPVVVDVMGRLGLRNLGWTVDTSDYTRPGVDQIVNRVAQGVRPGAIVLFHDGGGDRSQTIAAVSQLIDALRGAGYSFGTP